MRDYKGWTAEERRASLKKTKVAIAAGQIPPPTKCNRCGKTTGRIDYHNHDYSDPVKFLEPLCQGCHTRLHRLENKAATEDDADFAQETVSVEAVRSDSKSMSTKGDHMGAKSAELPDDLNSWLEKGMSLPSEELKKHLCQIPSGIKPLHALRGLGIVFSGGHTKDYSCPGYPQTSGLPKDSDRFGYVLEKVREYEKLGESLKVKGFPLSEKLLSNFANKK